jgi:hypothetical protein
MASTKGAEIAVVERTGQDLIIHDGVSLLVEFL